MASTELFPGDSKYIRVWPFFLPLGSIINDRYQPKHSSLPWNKIGRGVGDSVGRNEVVACSLPSGYPQVDERQVW